MSIEEKAKRLHTHKVVFDRNSFDEDVLVRAMMGQSSKAIAHATGLSVGQVQYRIGKGTLVGERAAYRAGNNTMFTLVYRMGKRLGKNRVQSEIAPKFAAFTPR